jgi:hypothetical protein
MPADKFAKWTERAKRVMVLAQEEAQRLNHNFIGTEHLLLGLLREGEGVAARVLQELGVQLSELQGAVEHVIGRGDSAVTGEVGLTPRAKRVLELTTQEARRLRHNYIGTEHLLLGLLREDEGVAAGILAGLGVSLPLAREEVVAVINQTPARGIRAQLRDRLMGSIHPPFIAGGRGEPAGPKDNVVTCRIDDRDLDALDALVEAGIRTTRSDAAAWLIHAGIDAHQPLFERVYATVAEIRQLRQEAQTIAQQYAAPAQAPAPPAPPAREQPAEGTPPQAIAAEEG